MKSSDSGTVILPRYVVEWVGDNWEVYDTKESRVVGLHGTKQEATEYIKELYKKLENA